MTRTEELTNIIKAHGDETLTKAAHLVEDVIFLEEQMTELKKLPFIVVNPKNPCQQKTTPAAKQYKELLQQYNNCLRLLFRLCGDLTGEEEKESPLREWVKSRKEGDS